MEARSAEFCTGSATRVGLTVFGKRRASRLGNRAQWVSAFFGS